MSLRASESSEILSIEHTINGDRGTFTGVVTTAGLPQKGTFESSSMDTFEGTFLDGAFHGVGTYTFAALEKGVYAGDFAFCSPHGSGKQTWSNGNVYDGDWARGEQHGGGVYEWRNGNRYDGEWARGKMHGAGTWQGANGNKYVGEWAGGRHHGRGTYTWAASQNVYCGDWSCGEMHGAGKLILGNGKVAHSGLWNKDKPVR
mmetsp:Transcript_55383/g.109820  ORF Transcript_55383/g.109820 Transcript_55383/m.109820 type:complete len:202 (+) Transcript_55383:92-697(+)